MDTVTHLTELISIDVFVDSLDWSADGRKLLVSPGVKVLYVGSGAERYIAPGLSVDDGRWAPDGARVAFTQVSPLPFNRRTRRFIVVAQPDGGNRKRVTGGAWDAEPAWSPDGKRIYFIRAPRGEATDLESEIYAIDLETRSLRRLTENDVVDRLPDPRPPRRSLPDPPEPRTGDIVVPDLVDRHVRFEDERRRFAELA